MGLNVIINNRYGITAGAEALGLRLGRYDRPSRGNPMDKEDNQSWTLMGLAHTDITKDNGV